MTDKNFKSYRGKILISNSSIITDDFNKSLVLMIEHDEEGAFGLVINKQSHLTIFDAIAGVSKEATQNMQMFWGGPVDQSFITILHQTPNLKNESSIEILSGVFLSRSYELLMELISSQESNFCVFHGYSSWGAGQLESEFQRKSWVPHDAKVEFIFEKQSEEAWREALKSKGGIYKYFAEHTKDPLLN
ncbi:MAG: YqgE/AlgH family protein [Spirochaetota bacterium]